MKYTAGYAHRRRNDSEPLLVLQELLAGVDTGLVIDRLATTGDRLYERSALRVHTVHRAGRPCLSEHRFYLTGKHRRRGVYPSEGGAVRLGPGRNSRGFKTLR